MKLKHGKRIIWNSEKANDKSKKKKKPKVVKKQGKDEKILGDSEELTEQYVIISWNIQMRTNVWVLQKEKNKEKLTGRFFKSWIR